MDINLGIADLYVAHRNAPDPVEPEDGTVVGVAGHEDVGQVPDDHHGAVFQVPGPITFIPETAIFFCICSLWTPHAPVFAVHHPNPGPAHGEADRPLEAGHRALEAEAVIVIGAVEAGDKDGVVDYRSGDHVRVLV